MTKIIGLVLIILGGVLIYQGINRQDSIAGKLDSAGTSVANSVDGGSRTPTHTVWIVSGCILAVVGLVVAIRPSRPI
ncbi:MAG TPA: DUF3185 family protein [Opitutaceae bacterium]|jgi:uncharacterized membrane protein YidH (DUF202 family)